MLWCAGFAARADDTPPADTPPADTPPADATPAPAPAPAPAKEIGRSIFVVNDVDGKSGDAPPQRLAVNDDIVFEEDIVTGADSKAIVEFRDGSTFEIGPDAAVRIDSFVFNPEESTSRKAIEVARGVFRYVSGYAASDQDTTIKTPHGQMGIRGSVAAGIVDPDVPDFVFLGEGAATFTNAGGSSALQPGNAIAVPDSATPPMPPDAMPPAVAEQALQAIDKRLPPREALRNRPAADDAWLKRAGAANLVPAAEQARYAESVATGRPPPSPAAGGPTARGSIAAELGLLVEGNRLNLFRGGRNPRTAEQTAFVGRIAREHPGAGAAMRRFADGARAVRAAALTVGTGFVLRGVALAAHSREVMNRVAAATLHANRGAGALVRRQVGEFDHRVGPHTGPERPANPRAERPGARPSERKSYVHPQNDFERRQTGNPHTPPGERHTGPPAQQQQPGKQPPGKQPPRKRRGDERDDNQRDNQR
jgi:FecR protein